MASGIVHADGESGEQADGSQETVGRQGKASKVQKDGKHSPMLTGSRRPAAEMQIPRLALLRFAQLRFAWDGEDKKRPTRWAVGRTVL